VEVTMATVKQNSCYSTGICSRTGGYSGCL